jgi:hypothetical protein
MPSTQVSRKKQPAPKLARIISGGQTGVDRAALDVALELGIEHGGWCPRGRLAEDGRIDARYHLRETDQAKYHIRTELNVQSSDGTLIVARGPLTGGTELTRQFATRHGKPFWIIDLDKPTRRAEFQAWLARENISVLNVAGPRESTSPGIYEATCPLLRSLLPT